MLEADAIDALSPELRRAARWMEAHPEDVALLSMRECARRAGMAPATFTRLAHALQHHGYDELKLLYQERLAGFTSRARALQRRGSDWLQALNQAHHADVDSVLGLNPRERLAAVADLMLKARRVCFLGLRASHGLAFHLQYTYSLLARNGVLLHDLGGTLSDQLDSIAPGDLLLAMSLAPYTRQTVEAVEQLAARHIDVVAVTDSEHSPLARAAKHSLLFRSDSPSYFQSMVGALALAEALAAAVVVRGGKRVLDRLQSVQRQLDERHAYVERSARRSPS